MKRTVWKAGSKSLCITMGALLLGSCEGKDGSFFIPTPYGPILLADDTPPLITNLRPATNIFLNDVGINFDAIDPTGDPGEPVSGLNIPAIRALYGTQVLPVTRLGTGNTFAIDISSIGEGQRSINLEVPDNVGLKASAAYTFRTDYSAPTTTFSGPTTGSSSLASSVVNFSGTYADVVSGIKLGKYYIQLPVNGQCTGNGASFPTGSGPGTVNQNEYDLTGGVYNINLTLNGPPNAMRPAVTTYCWAFYAEDLALDRNGAPKPNTTTRTWKLDFNWTAPPPPSTEGTVSGRVTVNGSTPLSGVTVAIPGRTTTTDANGNYTFSNVAAGSTTVTISNVPADVTCSPLSKTGSVIATQTTTVNFDCLRFSVSVAATYRHIMAGVSEVCAAISGLLSFVQGAEPIALENIAGASYTISWTGSGTVGTTNRSGTLNAQSTALDRQQINAFGVYTASVTVTYQGVTKLVTANVSVVGFPGTCPAP